MKRMFDFLCQDGHESERLVDDSIRTIECPACGKDANRLVSSPQVKLEGFTGAFPDAYDRWSKVRAEKLKQEQKRNAE
jgi:hypothetical protein